MNPPVTPPTPSEQAPPRDGEARKTDASSSRHTLGGRSHDEPRGKVHRRISPLTVRILTLNALALIILVAGLLYLGEYRQKLIDNELAAMRTHAEIFAVALGETSVNRGGETLLPELAPQIVRRLAFTAETRARLFDTDATLIADSRALLQPGGAITKGETLPPPEQQNSVLAYLLHAYDRIISWIPGTVDYPPYRENVNQRATDYPEVMSAFLGGTWSARRKKPDGSLVLSVAVPVRNYKQILGVLLLSKGSEDIDAALYEVRLDILKIFAVVLMVTILLSFYLAGSIVRPIRRLAIAAERIRNGHHRQHVIPPMLGRNDEIGELASSLRRMTEALWARMDAIERFAADVSHEIKNPLTSLKSAVETAARLKDPVQLKRLMEIIVEDVGRLDRLITDISDASRLDAEISRAETGTVNLSSMLETLVDLHTVTSTQGPRLTLESPPDIVVEGVESRLVQVFRNLIANAASFSPKDGEIAIRVAREGAGVVITITDGGPGIPPGKEAAIFERFYSERPEGEKFGTHSGLGLAISKQIIEAHGGTIEAANVADASGAVAGARFTVTLPA